MGTSFVYYLGLVWDSNVISASYVTCLNILNLGKLVWHVDLTCSLH